MLKLILVHCLKIFYLHVETYDHVIHEKEAVLSKHKKTKSKEGQEVHFPVSWFLKRNETMPSYC